MYHIALHPKPYIISCTSPSLPIFPLSCFYIFLKKNNVSAKSGLIFTNVSRKLQQIFSR